MQQEHENLKKEIDNWPDFWSREIILEKEHWRKNIELFVKSTEQILNYGNSDVMLDIGCGSGLLAELLKDIVKEIHGVDISESQIKICRDKFKSESNLFFYKLDKKDYTNLSLLKDKNFSLIIVLSVIQYYRDLDEVKKLIIEVRKRTKKGARMLIADIPIKEGIISDIWGLMKTAVREKSFIKPVKFLLMASSSSSYRKLLSKSGLLVIPEPKLNELITELHLDAEVLSLPLTDKTNRKHLLIRF